MFKYFQKEPFEHFVDGRDSLVRQAGGLVRYSRLVSIAVFIAIIFVAPFPETYLPTKLVFISSLLLFLFGLIYLRVRSERSLNMKYQLHMISHNIRDKQLEINKNNSSVNIEDVSVLFCSLIKDYFRILTKKEDIGVAIRIAIKKDKGIFFKTMGRAGLNANRAPTSEDLHENEGLAKFFNNNDGKHGIMLFNDFEESKLVFKFDENCRAYPKDIKTMMACPINGWDGSDKGMIGILYVTSKNKNVFGEKYTDSMGFISDALATVYSDLIVKLLSITDDNNINIILNDKQKYQYKGEKSEPIKIT